MNNGSQLDTLRDAIREKLREKRISAREASRQAGYNVGFVGDFLEGRAKSPAADRLQRVADVLGIKEPFGAKGSTLVPTEEIITSRKDNTALNQLVPLFSVAAPVGGQFMLVPAAPAGYVQTLPALEHIAGAYAFAIHNDFNEPRYFAGEIVYISPVAGVRAGDFVFVRFTDGRAGVTRVVEIADGKITLRCLKAPRAMSFAANEVLVMHRIVGATG